MIKGSQPGDEPRWNREGHPDPVREAANRKLGQRIKARRTKLGYSLRQFKARCGVSKTQVRFLERGRTKWPAADHIAKMSIPPRNQPAHPVPSRFGSHVPRRSQQAGTEMNTLRNAGK